MGTQFDLFMSKGIILQRKRSWIFFYSLDVLTYGGLYRFFSFSFSQITNLENAIRSAFFDEQRIQANKDKEQQARLNEMAEATRCMAKEETKCASL